VTQLKIFSKSETGGSMDTLEGAINAWLELERPRVVHFAQTVMGTDLVLSFVYVPTQGDAREALAEEAREVPDVFEQSLEQAELDPNRDAPLLPEAELPF
jgi:hypothetical protein